MLAVLFGLVHSKTTHTGAAIWDSSNTRMVVCRRRRRRKDYRDDVYERVAAQIGLCNSTNSAWQLCKPP